MRRLGWLLALLGVVGTLAGCGSSHQAKVYSGHLYSVAQVEKAFASLGFKLTRGPHQITGQVVLRNDSRAGPANPLPSPRGTLTVVVITRRKAAETSASHQDGRPERVMRYANVTALSKPGWPIGDEVRGAMSALRWGTDSPEKPGKRLIVLADSIGGIRLGEARRSVEKVLGPGRPGPFGAARYFGGRLLVGYEFHDRIYNYVTYVEARWSGYRVAGSGIHVGSTRQELRRLYVSCYQKVDCILEAGPWPDPLGTSFTVRRGKVAEIGIGRLA